MEKTIENYIEKLTQKKSITITHENAVRKEIRDGWTEVNREALDARRTRVYLEKQAKVKDYDTFVADLIKLKYPKSDTREAIFQKGIIDSNNQEFVEYHNYCEECKKSARKYLNII